MHFKLVGEILLSEGKYFVYMVCILFYFLYMYIYINYVLNMWMDFANSCLQVYVGFIKFYSLIIVDVVVFMRC